MSDSPLDSKELEAIQDAVRDAQGSTEVPTTAAHHAQDDVLPLALIADDRVAESARPAAMRLAECWASLAMTRLKHVLKGEVSIKVASADVIEGGALREDLEKMWICALTLSDRTGAAVVSAGGPMISEIAAKLLGGESDPNDAEEIVESPTAASLRVFEPVGVLLVETLALRWEGQDRCQINIDYSPQGIDIEKRTLFETDVIVAVTLTVTGPVNGSIRLLVPPALMVPPPKPMVSVPALPGAIESALGEVEVDVRVELGRTKLTLTELKHMRPGTIVALNQFVDDPLPIKLGGVVKAYGQAIITRGVLAARVVTDGDHRMTLQESNTPRENKNNT